MKTLVELLPSQREAYVHKLFSVLTQPGADMFQGARGGGPGGDGVARLQEVRPRGPRLGRRLRAASRGRHGRDAGLAVPRRPPLRPRPRRREERRPPPQVLTEELANSGQDRQDRDHLLRPLPLPALASNKFAFSSPVSFFSFALSKKCVREALEKLEVRMSRVKPLFSPLSSI